MTAELTPVESRAQASTFVTQCSLAGLQHRLPLPWPTPPDTPPSPKKNYRSYYVYLGGEDLQDPAAWEHLSPFDLLLRLVDFSGLRPVLAYLLGWTSARGHVPFDPVSLFLLLGWQITRGWNRAQTLRNLSDPRYADYAQRFGFKDNDFPTEGGLRYFLTTLGQHAENDQKIMVDEEKQLEVATQELNHLLAQSVTLIVQAGFLSPQAWQQALICPDGMLHQAASRLRCPSVQESCYQPAPRPCPAKHQNRQGCNCDSTACAPACRYAPPRDPQARFVWYANSNNSQHDPKQSTDPHQKETKRGKGYYGYCSLPLVLADPVRRFSLILLDDFLPANARLENPAAALLLQLHTFYPDLRVDAVAGDAAFGYEVFLHTVYDHLHARRVIDLRSHDTDRNKDLWPLRGYDDKGRLVCPFGYSYTANGHDSPRHRHKWACFQTCGHGVEPVTPLPDVTYPPQECPYQSSDHAPYGRIINVAERFQDDSIRLVRDLPVGTPAWKRLYHRARNAVEGRNAAFEAWGLKRLPVYGLPRNRALIFQADVWHNLTTLARLVREATAAAATT
jgi:hypothetical protein